MCELLKIGYVFRDMMDNKCANIFSTLKVNLSSKYLDT